MIPYSYPTKTVAQVTRLPPHGKQVNCNHLQSRLRNFILVAEHIALGNPFGEGPQVKLCFTTPYSSVGAMSILECLKWHNFVQIGEGDPALTTEGKNGIPRYAGDATKLAEYQFRVRLRQVREKLISDEEKKKIGPLGLRLVDGPSGPALQVVRDLPIEKLAEDQGPTFLLNALQAALQPRSNQEARELYQAGAQSGGILSRQTGESIASYVLRRRTWYTMMTDLDTKLKLPEQILAEQTLQNAGLSQDHQLLIRTAIGGEMTMGKLCEEMVAQHARIHEREHRGKGYGKSSAYKGMKGYGKKSSWRAYHVEAEENAEWENTSQSLGGYEDLEDQSYHAYEIEEPYADEVDTVFEAYAALVENGMDEEDQESLDYICRRDLASRGRGLLCTPVCIRRAERLCMGRNSELSSSRATEF